MTIDELITFCDEKEYNHRLSCKRYDDASGYTRSKDKNIRTACAIREENYADYCKEISATMRKYQKMQEYLDKIRAEIIEEKECAYADFERYKVEYLGQDWEYVYDSLPQDDFRNGMERAIEIIDKYGGQ